MSTPDARLSRRAVLLGAAACGLAACGRPPPPVEAQPAPKAEPPPEATAPVVTILGDSITAGLGLPAAEALPAQLERALLTLGVRARVRGAGVSGDTSAGGLARVDFSVQDDTAVCVVALGANDMFQGLAPSRVRRNLDAIIVRLQARGVAVVLAGMRAPPQYGGYAGEFDEVFPELARKRSVAFYPFLLEGVALDEGLNQPDGVHPNPKGVRVIAAGLAPVVALALRERAARSSAPSGVRPVG